jgi:hypothetical protein
MPTSQLSVKKQRHADTHSIKIKYALVQSSFISKPQQALVYEWHHLLVKLKLRSPEQHKNNSSITAPSIIRYSKSSKEMLKIGSALKKRRLDMRDRPS